MQPIVTELIALATLAVLNGLSSTANDNKEIEMYATQPKKRLAF